MEENQKFQVQIETGEIMEAELLSVVEIDDKEKVSNFIKFLCDERNIYTVL